MIKLLSKYLFCSVLVCLCVSSCIKDVDFEQAEDLVISPTMEASLIYFEEPATSFIDEDGVEAETDRDTIRIEIFSDAFIVDNLIKAEFLFEGTNTINRAYEAEIEFLDDEDQLQHEFVLAIPASPDNVNIIVEETEIFEGITLDALKMTTQLAFTVRLLPSDDGSIIDGNTPGDLRFRSKATFFLNIDVL